jgi:hypothetical protein
VLARAEDNSTLPCRPNIWAYPKIKKIIGAIKDEINAIERNDKKTMK